MSGSLGLLATNLEKEQETMTVEMEITSPYLTRFILLPRTSSLQLKLSFVLVAAPNMCLCG